MQAHSPFIYFCDVFAIDPMVLDDYGAFNIALVNDLPLFVDPFLLFDSLDARYKALHDDIITYLCFLRDRAVADELTPATISHWLLFKEVKQNWLGFSRNGNEGTGLGMDFAKSLAKNLASVFRNFGTETVTAGSHIEKLGLLNGGVGRDHLSDFTTNLIKGFLLQYTQTFALEHLRPEQRRKFAIDRVQFDYLSRRWKSGSFELPFHQGDFVLLTPKEILTRDDAWINQSDLLDQFTQVCMALPDDTLRVQVNAHFYQQINEKSKQGERKEAALRTIEKFHELLDYYILWKEEHAGEAHRQSDIKVQETQQQFVDNIKLLVNDYLAGSEFYDHGTSYAASLKRIHYLKHVIEDNDGYRVFYVDGKPVQRESDLHVMYRLTWFSTSFDVNAEVNNGRGPVDYKVSKGRDDACLVEFKLAKNTSLKKNLEHQVQIYKKANQTGRSIKVILHFSDAERERAMRILKDLDLLGREDIILIDANRDNKPSASKADES